LSSYLFNDGLQTDGDRALFGVCLYTACMGFYGKSLESHEYYRFNFQKDTWLSRCASV